MWLRYLLLLFFLLLLSPAYGDNYSGGGGGGGGGGGVTSLATVCPTSAAASGALTLNNSLVINAETGNYGPFATDCGQAFTFTLAAPATYSLPAPSAGFQIPAITNVPSSTASLTLSPASGNICAATCASTYVIPAGSSTVSLYSDGTNYYVQFVPPPGAAITGPGYVVGLWYSPSSVTGTAAATLAMSATTAYCYPTWINNVLSPPTGGGTMTIGTVGISVTTLGAAGNIQVALYNNSAGDRPGTLVAASANLSTNTTGTPTAAITAAGVKMGMYWWCTQADNTTVRTTVPNSISSLPFLAGNVANTNMFNNTSPQVSTTTGITAFGTWPNFTSATWAQLGSTASLIMFTPSSIP